MTCARDVGRRRAEVLQIDVRESGSRSPAKGVGHLIGGREAGSLDHGTALKGLSPTEDMATALSIVDLLVGRGQRDRCA